MDGDEQGRCQRHGHAVQDVEAQKRIFADHTRSQQQKARIGAGMDQGNAADLQERRARSFMPHERMCPRHVAADRDGPDG